MSLCLFTDQDLQHGKVSMELELHPAHNKTGDIWHIAVPGLDRSLLYGMYLLPACLSNMIAYLPQTLLQVSECLDSIKRRKSLIIVPLRPLTPYRQ